MSFPTQSCVKEKSIHLVLSCVKHSQPTSSSEISFRSVSSTTQFYSFSWRYLFSYFNPVFHVLCLSAVEKWLYDSLQLFNIPQVQLTWSESFSGWVWIKVCIRVCVCWMCVCFCGASNRSMKTRCNRWRERIVSSRAGTRRRTPRWVDPTEPPNGNHRWVLCVCVCWIGRMRQGVSNQGGFIWTGFLFLCSKKKKEKEGEAGGVWGWGWTGAGGWGKRALFLLTFTAGTLCLDAPAEKNICFR